MGNEKRSADMRLIPEIPVSGQRMRLVFDTDAGAEIDDLYAISLALASPDRFDIEGFVATHFAATYGVGPESIDKSYAVITKLIELASTDRKIPVKRGANPMQYSTIPSKAEGVDLIIQRAHAGSIDNPLWVLGTGAATNLGSAILEDPTIAPKVRYVFHARSSETWPERSTQYNVEGDILAARALLRSNVPLVWFDTGSNLKCSFEDTEKHLSTSGPLGKYIHEYRNNHPQWLTLDKGFFDLGDVAWMIQPDLCTMEIVPAPAMSQHMYFDHSKANGSMLRVFNINNEGTWRLLFDRMYKYSSGN